MQVLYKDGSTRDLGTIFCLARNYGAHAQELNNAVPESPVVFCKPATAFSQSEKVCLPLFSQNVHFETELVVQLGKGGRFIAEDEALECVIGVALGLDLTARDVQEALKGKGYPWELAKGFDGAAALSLFTPYKKGIDLNALSFLMSLNGELKQRGNSAEMIFSIARQIAFLSAHFTLRAGDLIFTGTPAGVGALNAGDVVEVFSRDLNLSKRWKIVRGEMDF